MEPGDTDRGLVGEYVYLFLLNKYKASPDKGPFSKEGLLHS